MCRAWHGFSVNVLKVYGCVFKTCVDPMGRGDEWGDVDREGWEDGKRIGGENKNNGER